MKTTQGHFVKTHSQRLTYGDTLNAFSLKPETKHNEVQSYQSCSTEVLVSAIREEKQKFNKQERKKENSLFMDNLTIEKNHKENNKKTAITKQ